MSGVQRGVTNAFGLPAISAATTDSRRPRYGLPWQLFFNVNDKIIYYDSGTNWEIFSQPYGGLNFGSGLTQLGANVTNNLTTGKSAGNIIFGFDDDFNGIGLQLWSTTTAGIYSSYILFGSWDDNGTAYFSNSGAWNFGANTDPSLTTPYLYVFQSRGVFNARWDFNANIALLNTTGSHIQSAWQTTAPTGNANQTHLFFDSVGSPSFRIGTNNWFKFEPASLTATRTYTLQDSSYTLAGLNIAQTFSALQTFSAGATFGAAINATAGSVTNASINFGTTNTGIYSTASNVIRFTCNSINSVTIDNTGLIASSLWINTSGLISISTATIRAGANSPEGVITANVGSLYLRTNGGANTTLYVKESGTGNTGWVAK